MKAVLALSLLGLVPRLGYDTDTVRAVAFHHGGRTVLLTYPAWHTRIQALPNAYLHAAVAAGLIVQLGAAWLPLASAMLGGTYIPLELWGLVIVGALVSWALAETVARVVWRGPASGRDDH